MKQVRQRLAEAYGRLAGRERLLVLLAVCVVLVVLVFVGALEPMWKQDRELQQKAAAATRQLAATDTQQRQLAMALQQDPDAAERRQLAAAQQHLAEVDRQLQAVQGRLVPAGQMAALLEQLLRAHGRLRLVSLKTLPVAPLEAAAPGKAAGAATDLYKHGVEICVQGSYFDLLAYVQSIERLPANMIWADMRFKVDDYPVNTLTLTFYTLSLDRIWLSV